MHSGANLHYLFTFMALCFIKRAKCYL
jgi:hypothetical protein